MGSSSSKCPEQIPCKCNKNTLINTTRTPNNTIRTSNNNTTRTPNNTTTRTPNNTTTRTSNNTTRTPKNNTRTSNNTTPKQNILNIKPINANNNLNKIINSLPTTPPKELVEMFETIKPALETAGVKNTNLDYQKFYDELKKSLNKLKDVQNKLSKEELKELTTNLKNMNIRGIFTILKNNPSVEKEYNELRTDFITQTKNIIQPKLNSLSGFEGIAAKKMFSMSANRLIGGLIP